jgi:GDPmannose 4,6-dehydratase
MADAAQARRVLGWEPRIFFRDLVRIMVDAEMELVGLQPPGEGRKALEANHGKWHRWEDQIASMRG